MEAMKMQDTNAYIKNICQKYDDYNKIDPSLFQSESVKRGLRNADGTGVKAGVTRVGDVHGYKMTEQGEAILENGRVVPDDGVLTYRGIDVLKIIKGCEEEDRYGFEEVAFLLLFGYLPSAKELGDFIEILGAFRFLPDGFTEDVLLRAPSPNIMTSLGRAVLALYAYDNNPEDLSLENMLRQSIELIARFPLIVAHAFQAKMHYFDKESMYLHFPKENLSTAENLLRTMRPSKAFTAAEAKLLDLALVLHAEHGGGNNSTFAARVLASADTDTYSTISGAVGSPLIFRK